MCIRLSTAITFKKQTNITILNVHKGRELVIITYAKVFGKNWH